MIAPAILIMVALVYVPLAITFGQSFFRVDPMQPTTPFIGFRNYVRLFSDDDVARAWGNTFKYVAIAVTAETLLGVGAALLINRMRRGRKVMIAVLILPWALPPVIIALVWSWIYHPSAGLLTGILKQTGILTENVVWFNDPTTALVLISLVHIWRMMPQTAIIFLAALQLIPKELYEAGQLDGAPRFTMFRLITLPLAAGGLAVALTQSTVFAFNLFDEAWILAGRGLDTRTILMEVYVLAFLDLRFSYGMALSVLVMLASIAISMLYVVRVQRDSGLDKS
jgi:multiple sugar transport system permease protein